MVGSRVRPIKKAETVFGLMEKFGGYGFNKFKGCICLDDLLPVIDFKKELGSVMKKVMVSNVTRVMRSLEVLNMLNSVMSARSARSYYAIYMLLVTQGQDEVKRQISKSNYYRAVSIFREYNISVVASDIEKTVGFKENSEFEYMLGMGFPVDFSLDMDANNKYYQVPKAA